MTADQARRRPSRPTLAELQAVCQPEAVLGRRNAEHWVGRLYMRRLSLPLTRLLLPTGISPNGVTWLMIAVGLLGALALATLPGVAGPLLAVLLMQAQILFDCSDGEVARWRGIASPSGVYLDRVGHYLTEAALPIALGVRVSGGVGSLDGWTSLGLVLALLWLLTKLETDLVHVARAVAGRPPAADSAAVSAPRAGALRSLRRALRFAPFFRLFVAVEFSLLTLGAAILDTVLGGGSGSRGLLLFLLPVALVTVSGHLVSVLASERLR